MSSAVVGKTSSAGKVPCKLDLDNCFAVAIPKGATGLGACSSCKAYKDSITALKAEGEDAGKSPTTCDGDFIAGDGKWFRNMYTFDIESGCGACPKGFEPMKVKETGKHIYCVRKDDKRGSETSTSLYCDLTFTKQLMKTTGSMCSGPTVQTHDYLVVFA